MPTTFQQQSDPNNKYAFKVPDEGEVFQVDGNIHNFYRRNGSSIETVNYVNSLLGAEAGQFGNAGEQRQEAIRRAQAQGLNLEAQSYNWGDISSTGLFQMGGNGGPTSTYTGDLTSFLNQRAGLPTTQTTLTQNPLGPNPINPYGQGTLTDQNGNIIRDQTQYTVAQAQANAMATNAGLSAPTPEMTQMAQQNAQNMGSQGVNQGYIPQTPTVGTLPRAQVLAGQLNPASQKATNLNDFYTALGTPLPSLGDRAGLYEKAGLGTRGEYRGTAAQNASLLKTLQSQSSMGGTGGIQEAKDLTTDIFKKVPGFEIPQPGITIPGGSFMPSLDELLKRLSQPTAAEQAMDSASKEILKRIDQQGSEQSDLIAARQQELQKMGFASEADFDKQVNDLMSSMRTDITNYKTQSEQIRNQPIPQNFVIGQQNELGRAYDIKTGEKALMLETLKGYKDSANDRAKELVDAKYSQIENDINYLFQVYNMNKDKLGREDQKQAQALELWLGFRKEALDAQKAEDEKVYNIGMEVLSNGGGTVLANKIFKASSPQEALALGGSYIGKLDRDQQALENSLANKKFGLDQAEFNLRKNELAQAKADSAAAVTLQKQEEQLKAVQDSTGKLQTIDDRIAAIKALKTDPGLDSRVGPNVLARGWFSTGDRFGAGDSFAGNVHQLTSQDTLQTLLNLKQQGGTLGALSDKEADLLRAAASKINGWEIKDKNGNFTGEWKIDQKSFLKELDTLETLAIRAKNKVLSGIVSADDLNEIDSIK